MSINRDYTTLLDAINDLKRRGYTSDFNVKQHCLTCGEDFDLQTHEFEVDEMYRFEGDSNPDDSSIIYAISSEKHNMKGILVFAHSIYADPLSPGLVEKLRYRPN
ncbi:MAG: phosphoribosylpyrophosphate synthetase [Saprospiraceae bacterium]|nr:phosphoribosylpyrophosphate synthetase [Saprospiraceae bacterium]